MIDIPPRWERGGPGQSAKGPLVPGRHQKRGKFSRRLIGPPIEKARAWKAQAREVRT
jgi:hypothetical protein